MAVTQKMYLGGVSVIKNYLGEDPIVSAGAYQFPSLSTEWLLIGGGGAGALYGNTGGGSGGAGRFVSASMDITPQSISVTIGTGGAGKTWGSADSQGNDGGGSSVIISGTTYTAPGGGGGGAGLSNPADARRNGRDGGSGGGTGGSGGTTGKDVLGTPIAGFGNDGQVGSSNVGGNGGGAGGTPTGRAWVNGVTYAGGGGSGLTTAGSGTVGGSGIGVSTTSGQNGIFIVRYLGTPRATGGTITQTGGYTYHTFSSNGTFTYPA